MSTTSRTFSDGSLRQTDAESQRVPVARAAVVAVAVALAAAGAGAQQFPVVENRLELEESWSVALPAGMEARGLVVGGHGEIVVFGPWGVGRVDSGDHSVRVVGSFQSLSVVGAAVTRDGIELLDSNSGRVVGVGQDGRVRSWRPLSVPGTIQAGAVSSCGWTIASSSLSGTSVELVIETGDESMTLDLPLTGEVALSAVPWRSEVLLTEAVAPFRSLMVNCDDDSLRITHFERPSLAMVDPTTWRSLGAFAFHALAVRTLADTGSDRRIVTVNALSGPLIRVTPVEVPMAFVASHCESRVAAVRRIEAVEIVLMTPAGAVRDRCGR
jgi:hypothetical protein